MKPEELYDKHYGAGSYSNLDVSERIRMSNIILEAKQQGVALMSEALD